MMIRWTAQYFREQGDAEPTRARLLVAADLAAARQDAEEHRQEGETHVEVEEGPAQFRTNPSFEPSPD